LGSNCIVAGDVDSVILPKDSCGGEGTLAFARASRKHKPLIITVQENETVLDDTPDKFGIEAVCNLYMSFVTLQILSLSHKLIYLSIC